MSPYCDALFYGLLLDMCCEMDVSMNLGVLFVGVLINRDTKTFFGNHEWGRALLMSRLYAVKLPYLTPC